MLRAECGGKTPTQRVLITGRKKRARLVNRKYQPGGKTDLRYLIDKNAVLGKFGADGVEECDLRGKLLHPLAPNRLPLPQLRLARGALVIVRRQFGEKALQNRLGVAGQRHCGSVQAIVFLRIGVKADHGEIAIDAPMLDREKEPRADGQDYV